jgi:hypothetical protein
MGCTRLPGRCLKAGNSRRQNIVADFIRFCGSVAVPERTVVVAGGQIETGQRYRVVRVGGALSTVWEVVSSCANSRF